MKSLRCLVPRHPPRQIDRQPWRSTASHNATIKTRLRVALCQMRVNCSDKKANLKEAQRMIAVAANNGAQLVVLPEIWNSPYSTAAFPVNAECIPGGTSSKILSEAARDSAIWLVGGSIPERSHDGKLYNTCGVYNPEGKLVAKHRKVHLFDIDISGKITFKESETLAGGDAITVFDTPWGKVGVGVCYDLRFPEMASVMRQRGAKILVYPGAFNTTTGPLHWELLQRARANDTQSFVLTASPARGDDPTEYQAWGHSSAVDPWGAVIATTNHHPDIVMADLDLCQVDEVRQSIPISFQSRNDLYTIADHKAPSCT